MEVPSLSIGGLPYAVVLGGMASQTTRGEAVTTKQRNCSTEQVGLGNVSECVWVIEWSS